MDGKKEKKFLQRDDGGKGFSKGEVGATFG